MKILRILLMIIGLVLVISQIYFIIIFTIDPKIAKIAAGKEHGFWSIYFAPILTLVIGGLFLFIANRINRKIKKKKIIDLIKALPE
jgi:hypothetical protein